MKSAAPDLPDPRVGLCGACRHVRVVRSDRGSVFYQCQRSFTDAAFPAYPRLPVLRCAGYDPQAGASDAPRDESRSGR
jgi:hypothetical protein